METTQGYLPSLRNDERSALITTIIKYDASQKDSYIYRPLTERDSIRLLRIQPADEVDADLHLSITHTTLSTMTASNGDPLEFIALSYFWGPQVFRKPVYIEPGDEAIRIHREISDDYFEERATQRREDLRKHLEAMRVSTLLAYSEEAKQLAKVTFGKAAQRTCSNSSDATSTQALHIGRNIRERNHQVLHMRKIYQRASATVVYLGDEIGYTSLSAWNFLERIAAKESDKGKHNALHFRGDLGDVENDVLTRPWFRRVWVVQEIAVSANITMQCGQRFMSWDDFCKVILLEPRVNDRYGLSLENKQLYENETRGTYVLDMVARSRRLEATDPRDKIFALLGISSGVDPDDSRIAVDYSKSLSQVYEDFARYTIDAGRSFDVLSYAVASLEWDWPTWVPDWRQTMPTSRNILSCIPLYAGGGQGRQHESSEMNDRWLKDEDHLQCSGNDELAFEQIRRECGADTEKMNTRILERWKTYPWKFESWERDQTMRKNASSSKFQPTPWDDLPLNIHAKSMSLRDRKPLSLSIREKLTWPVGLCEQPVSTKSNEGKSNLSYHPSRSRVVLEHLIQRSRQTLVWTDDESMAVETVLDRSSVIDNRRLGLMLKQGITIPEPERIIFKPTTSSSSTKEDKSLSPWPWRFAGPRRLRQRFSKSRGPQVRATRGYILASHDSSPQHRHLYTLMLLPPAAKVGDYVVSLVGARVPFVIRLLPSANDSGPTKSCLVGECLVEDDDIVGLGSPRDTLVSPPSRPLHSFALGAFFSPADEERLYIDNDLKKLV
ncbi:hypothetical protein PSPO01_11051 [Paraphaeosphaeria sporulosa]